MKGERSTLLFRRNIDPSCAYCKHGLPIGQSEIACRKRGIMTEEGKCGLFRYEPTKRRPEYMKNMNVNMEDISEADFRI
jgi:hypothetical protein